MRERKRREQKTSRDTGRTRTKQNKERRQKKGGRGEGRENEVVNVLVEKILVNRKTDGAKAKRKQTKRIRNQKQEQHNSTEKK